MKKKILTAILSGLLIATLAGCGNQLPENDMPESMASADTTSVTGREIDADSSSTPETASEPETSGTVSPETKPQAEKEEKTKPAQTDTSSAAETSASPTEQPAETAPPKTDTPKPTEPPKQTETPKPTEQPKETEPPKADTPPETEKPEPTQPPETEEPAPPPTVEEPAFDIGYWIAYAQSYAGSVGLRLESSAVDCWDNPITAGAHSLYLERDIQSRLNRYAKDEDITDVWIWSESIGNGEYNIYIGYA